MFATFYKKIIDNFILTNRREVRISVLIFVYAKECLMACIHWSMNDKYDILHTMFRERVNTLPHIGTTKMMFRELLRRWDLNHVCGHVTHVTYTTHFSIFSINKGVGRYLGSYFCKSQLRSNSQNIILVVLCPHVLIVIFNPDIFPIQILPKERL